MNLLGHLVGFLGWGISPTQGLYLHTGQHNTEKRGHTSMPRAGFDPTIPVFERPKTVRALDRAANGTGSSQYITYATNKTSLNKVGRPTSNTCIYTILRSTSNVKLKIIRPPDFVLEDRNPWDWTPRPPPHVYYKTFLLKPLLSWNNRMKIELNKVI
jgi:hypothetical protein